ncbi:heavy-metal-associated domain-containing protein [Brevundimonas sp.]|uniref:heavy-metal-associated domain-containing protein n=1 Tax=Brevundimonas sp. TaxID=1871086 RepID=UPI002EDAFA32
MSAHGPGVTDLQVLNIPKIRCGGCVAGVEKAIHSVDASAQITADIEARRVEVTTSADPKTLMAALADAGYPAEAA